jgi:hypothetical protein
MANEVSATTILNIKEVIAKNTTDFPIEIEDMGIIITASPGQRTLSDNFTQDEITSSDDLLYFVNAGDIIINNGTEDLSNDLAIDYITTNTLSRDPNDNIYNASQIQSIPVRTTPPVDADTLLYDVNSNEIYWGLSGDSTSYIEAWQNGIQQYVDINKVDWSVNFTLSNDVSDKVGVEVNYDSPIWNANQFQSYPIQPQTDPPLHGGIYIFDEAVGDAGEFVLEYFHSPGGGPITFPLIYSETQAGKYDWIKMATDDLPEIGFVLAFPIKIRDAAIWLQTSSNKACNIELWIEDEYQYDLFDIPALSSNFAIARLDLETIVDWKKRIRLRVSNDNVTLKKFSISLTVERIAPLT